MKRPTRINPKIKRLYSLLKACKENGDMGPTFADGGILTSNLRIATKLRWAPETARKHLRWLERKEIVSIKQRGPRGMVIYVKDKPMGALQ